MRVRDFLGVINGIAPFRLAENWDNCGLQAGDPSWPVTRVMVCLDVTPDAMAAARQAGCDLLLSHHPLMMGGIKSVDFSVMPGLALAAAATDRISIISAHTNLDKAENGLNDYFARKIGIGCLSPLLQGDDPDQPRAGTGRLGLLASELTLGNLAIQIKQALGISALRVIGSLDTRVREVAICTGSGGSLTREFLSSQAQVYITGDLKYHEARDIEAAGKAAVDVGHFASESIVTHLLKTQLDALSLDDGRLEIIEYKKEEDPFIII